MKQINKILSLLLAVMMIFAASVALADDDAQITAQGTAQVMADPDMVTVTANASVTAGTVGSAQEEMNRIVASATAKLLELGVKDEDIVTTDYSYFPRYNYDTNTLTGYDANHTLSITCRDVEMLDSVIGVLSDNGFSQVYSVTYDVSTRSELYRQALELAIACAREKAERMASAGGVKLTGLESITEQGGYGDAYILNGAADMGVMKTESAATGIRSGNVSVGASVTVVYEATK